MTTQAITLINLLKVEPANQAALIELLEQNIETVVTTLDGWKSSRLIAASDGASVIIYSEWETPEAIAAMRSDPRMMAYFPRIGELASLQSTMGEAVYTNTKVKA